MNPPARQLPVANETPFKTDIVQNIPMQTQMPYVPAKDKDDVELDLLMQDVGQELKKNVNRPAKHHFFSKKAKTSQIKLSKTVTKTTLDGLQLAKPQPIPQLQTQTQNQAHPASNRPDRPKTKQSVPVFMILVTFIITSVLIVVAVTTY